MVENKKYEENKNLERLFKFARCSCKREGYIFCFRIVILTGEVCGIAFETYPLVINIYHTWIVK